MLHSRRGILSIAAGSLLSACASFRDRSPYWATIAAGFDPPDGLKISREYTDKLPYASMQAWFEGGAKALIVLADKGEDGRLNWHSAERQQITTWGAFVVRSIGTDLELRDTILNGDWKRDPRAMRGERMTRILDILAEGDRIQLPLWSTFKGRGTERREILGRPYDLERVDEVVRDRKRVRYSNSYWLDGEGRCWKSRQIVVPRLPHLNIEILKYPG